MFCPYGHKSFEYKFCTLTREASNRNVISNKYYILIGGFWSMSTKKVLWPWDQLLLAVAKIVITSTIKNLRREAEDISLQEHMVSSVFFFYYNMESMSSKLLFLFMFVFLLYLFYIMIVVFFFTSWIWVFWQLMLNISYSINFLLFLSTGIYYIFYLMTKTTGYYGNL